MSQPVSLLLAIRRGRAPLIAAALLVCPLAARGAIEISIRGVDEDVRKNVLAYLSFERYRNSNDLERDVLNRLHDRVDREVKSALRPFGYYDPTVRSNLNDRGGGDWLVTVEIEPGAPVVMKNVDLRVLGPGADDPLFRNVINSSGLRIGERLQHSAYEQTKNSLQRTASTYGYIEAHLTRNELRVDPATREASAILELESGPRYRFGATSIEQDTIDDALVKRFMRYTEDEPFDLTQLLRTQFALDDSQYFSTVEVLAGDPDREQHVVPVSIQASPNRRNRYSFGFGYGTDTGPRGTTTWENRRINQRGHHLYSELQVAEIEQTLVSRYIIPIGDPALEKLTFELTGEQRELGDLDVENLNFEPSITTVSGRWQRVLFVTATHTNTASIVNNRTDKLLIPGISYATVPQGYLGEPLFERMFSAELRGSHSVFGSDSDFIQLHVQAERIFDITQKWHLMLRGEVGASLVAEFSELPGSVRFFAGGDRSVRGFGYNELSPEVLAVVPNDQGVLEERLVKVGGKHVLTGTVEIIRDLPRNLGIAVFSDFGNAFDKFGDPLEYSAGIGLRLRLPIVTLGVDVAQPLSESGDGPRLHISFLPKL